MRMFLTKCSKHSTNPTHTTHPHRQTHDGNPTEHTTKNPLTQTTSPNTTNKNSKPPSLVQTADAPLVVNQITQSTRTPTYVKETDDDDLFEILFSKK